MEGRAHRVCGASAVAAALACVAGPALAQTYDRGRNVSVTERSRPDYEAAGARLGGFLLYPRVQANAEATDNLLARPDDEVGDLLLRLAPEVRLQSDWSRNAVSLFARAAHNRALDTSSERWTDYGLGGEGRLQLGEALVTAGAELGRATEERTETNARRDAVEPNQFDTARLFVRGQQTLARSRLSGGLEWRTADFEDNRDRLGRRIEQDDRDLDFTQASCRSE